MSATTACLRSDTPLNRRPLITSLPFPKNRLHSRDMELKTLKSVSPVAIHQAFVDAFADYVVDIPMPYPAFREMMVRRGVQYSASMGAFDGGRLVGFVLNGLRPWNGELTCYDSGTGVLPSHRGRGLSTAMLEALLPVLHRLGVTQYLLEVIKANEPAFNIYQKAGFEIVRSLSCYEINRSALRFGTQDDSLSAKLVHNREWDWEQLRRFWQFEPSWQNSIDSVMAGWNDFVNIHLMVDNTPVGYGIVHQTSGDIPQFAVSRELRRQGLGQRLFKGLSESTDSKALRIINVDDTDLPTCRFIAQLGFDEMAAQYEMIRPL